MVCILFYKLLYHEEPWPDLMEKIMNHPETLEFHVDMTNERDFVLSPWEELSVLFIERKLQIDIWWLESLLWQRPITVQEHHVPLSSGHIARFLCPMQLEVVDSSLKNEMRAAYSIQYPAKQGAASYSLSPSTSLSCRYLNFFVNQVLNTVELLWMWILSSYVEDSCSLNLNIHCGLWIGKK